VTHIGGISRRAFRQEVADQQAEVDGF